MHIVICGAGQVGCNIARQLSREENSITVIDQNPTLIREINESLDVRAFHGSASHPSDLEDAGIAEADMLIAVTHSDEVNMIACQVAHSLFNVPMKIARIRHQDFLRPKWKTFYASDKMPIDYIISPELEVAQAIIRRLQVPGAVDSVPFFGGALMALAIRCEENCPLANLPFHLAEQRLSGQQVTMLGVISKQKFSLPKSNTILAAGDIVYALVTPRDVRPLLAAFGHHEREARRVLIIGGGNIGLYIAQAVERLDQDIRVKLIETSKERAQLIAGRVDHTTVIHGSGLEQDILLECGIESSDTVIAVTNDDKVNILASLLSKRLSCERTVALVNSSSYISLLGNLGIDVIVNPKETTVSSILQHVRRGRIRAVHSIHDGAAEIIEAEAMETSPLVGRTVGNIELPRGVRMGAILRGKEVIFPGPDTPIHQDDRIVLLSIAESVRQVEQLFSVSLEYF